jgi:hypothetical protein
MKRLLTAFAALLALSTFITACGGSGGNGDGAPGYTHNQLAELFVQKLNASGDFEVQLAKSSTQRDGYIVVLDRSTNEYNAYNINGYSPEQDAVIFIGSTNQYSDLDYIPGYYQQYYSSRYDYGCECYVSSNYSVYVSATYRDRATGIVFEKTSGTPKDRMKLAALKEAFTVQNMASTLSANYGLSAERSQEVAKTTFLWQQQPKERMTDADHDRFAKEILGHSITDYKAAAQKASAGDRSALNQLIEDSARANGITAEDANQIVNGLL